MFFLVMALSQFVPELKVGIIYTYWGPLAFVTMVGKEHDSISAFHKNKFSFIDKHVPRRV